MSGRLGNNSDWGRWYMQMYKKGKRGREWRGVIIFFVLIRTNLQKKWSSESSLTSFIKNLDQQLKKLLPFAGFHQRFSGQILKFFKANKRPVTTQKTAQKEPRSFLKKH